MKRYKRVNRSYEMREERKSRERRGSETEGKVRDG